MTDPAEKRHAQQASYRPHALSTVWLVPLLAFIVVGWMAWMTWHDSGPTIHITFDTTAGVEINRTQIRHKGVVLGTVTALTPSSDFSHVMVSAHMDSAATPYLNKDTKFWVVEPRFSLGAISDLNTLVSGVYIELSPNKKGQDSARDFTGLNEPLAVDQREAGKSFALHAPQVGSLERGSPLYFHGFDVGEVSNFELAPDKSVTINIFVRAPYDKLVLQQTRFWNVSGIGVTAGPNGFKIAAQSLQAVVEGGIAFDVPPGIDGGDEAAANDNFPLYNDRDLADDSIYTKKISYLLRFTGSVSGLDPGGTVELLGNRVGSIAGTRIKVDGKTGTAISEVTVDIRPERMHFANRDSGTIEQRARASFREMVKHNLRAQVATGNLLTGQKNINFDFVPNAPPAVIVDASPYPIFPTVPPNDLEAVMRDARGLMQDADKTVREAGPLLDSLKTTTDQINTGDTNGGLSGTLYEIKRAAESLRTLTDDLDAHPESILRGKQETKP